MITSCQISSHATSTRITKDVPDAGDCNYEDEIVMNGLKVSGIQLRSQHAQAAGDGSDFILEDQSVSDCKRCPSTSINSSSLASNDEYMEENDRASTSFTNNTSTSNSENKTNLIINYLPPTVSQEDIKLLFSGIGEVESCKLVREKSTGESLGYAFVKFFKSSDAEKAIESLNGLQLHNKTVKVSLARPSCDAIKGANLYICGLPRTMTNEELEELFKPCGYIITTRILIDQKTSASRGVAFIRFDQRSEAEFAINRLNGFLLPHTNEAITVKFANSPGSSSDGRTSISSKSTATSGHRRSKYTSPSSKSSLNHKIKFSSIESMQDTPIQPKLPSPLIYQPQIPPVYGVSQPSVPPFHFKHSNNISFPQVRSYGSEFAMPSFISHPRIFQHPLYQGNPMGFCRLTGCGHFQRPIALSKFKQQPRDLMIAGTPSTNPLLNIPPYRQSNMHRGKFNNESDASMATRSLLAPAFAANSGALTTNGWCIFVYNLSTETEDAVLWQLFGPFGAVHGAKIIHDPVTGKCKGYGFVTMSNYEEAVKAIHALSGFSLDNRILQVSFKTTRPNEQFTGPSPPINQHRSFPSQKRHMRHQAA